MFKITLRQQLEKHFPDRELVRWFDPLDMNMDEDGRILHVSFPHSFFGRWFMEGMKGHFERQALSLFQDVTIIYDTGLAAAKSKNGSSSSYASGTLKTGVDSFFRRNESSSSPLPSPRSQVQPQAKSRENDALSQPSGLPLIEEYKFENFLANKKNDLPLAAAKNAVHTQRNSDAVPFVLYGQSGSGKSHLLCAMAHALRGQELPFYFGSIEFLEFVALSPNNYILAGAQAVFLDDIQRVKSFPNLQDALVALIDAFCASRQLLALALDMHPSQCSSLQPQLRSRLNSGLSVELKKPDMDIRSQYVHTLNSLHDLGLDKSNVLAIVRKYQDIRGIDGFISKLRFSRSLKKNQPPGATGNSDFQDLFSRDGVSVFLNHSHIINTAARHFSLSPEDIVGKNRDRRATFARDVSILLCRELLGLSLVHIGRIFGGRNHATILYSLKKIRELQESDKDAHNAVEKMRKLCLTEQ